MSCGSSLTVVAQAEFPNKADASAVMNDCNQCNNFFPKSTAKLCLAKVHPVHVSFVCALEHLHHCSPKKFCTEVYRKYLHMDKPLSDDSVYETVSVCLPVCLSPLPHMSIGNRSSSHLGLNPTQRVVQTGATIL